MLVTLGFVRASHGVHGTLKCAYSTDRPDTLVNYDHVVLNDDESGEIISARVESVTLRPSDFLLKLKGIDERSRAERFKFWFVGIPVSKVIPRDEDEFFPWQLEGLKVVKRDGTEIGTVKELVFTPANPILEIESGETSFYIVFSLEQVPLVDLEAGLIVVADFVGEGFQ